jgi:hypothetical protein
MVNVRSAAIASPIAFMQDRHGRNSDSQDTIHIVVFKCSDVPCAYAAAGASDYDQSRAMAQFRGPGQYAGAFEEHAIGWDVLSNLNHSILKDVGVSAAGDRVGDRVPVAVRLYAQ